MKDLTSVRDDLQYIRNSLEHQEDPNPLYSRIMWALYCLIGFIWLDFWPHGGSNFLLIGGVACAVTEIVVGSVFGFRKGEQKRDRDKREVLQTAAFLLAGVVIWLLMIRGHFGSGYSPGQMFLVLVGYHILSAGIRSNQSRAFQWNGAVFVGLCLLAGAVMISFVPTGVWSTLGIIVGTVIAFGFRTPGKNSAPAPTFS